NATSALKAATERLAHLGMIKTPKLRPRIRNIVVVGDLGVSLDLESVSKRLRHVIYEPEQFPGALYFPEELEGSSITLFASGKVIVAGLKAFESIETCKTVLRKLEGFV